MRALLNGTRFNHQTGLLDLGTLTPGQSAPASPATLSTFVRDVKGQDGDWVSVPHSPIDYVLNAERYPNGFDISSEQRRTFEGHAMISEGGGARQNYSIHDRSLNGAPSKYVTFRLDDGTTNVNLTQGAGQRTYIQDITQRPSETRLNRGLALITHLEDALTVLTGADRLITTENPEFATKARLLSVVFYALKKAYVDHPPLNPQVEIKSTGEGWNAGSKISSMTFNRDSQRATFNLFNGTSVSLDLSAETVVWPSSLECLFYGASVCLTIDQRLQLAGNTTARGEPLFEALQDESDEQELLSWLLQIGQETVRQMDEQVAGKT